MNICRLSLKSGHWIWGEISGEVVSELLLTSSDPLEFIRSDRVFSREDCKFLIPALPTQLIGIGDNYRRGEEDRKSPVVFQKPLNSLVPNFSTVYLPQNADTWGEPEIGLVIKKSCANLSDFSPEEYILGYCLINDTTTLFHSGDKNSHTSEAKGQAGFCQIGDIIRTDFSYSSAVITGLVNGHPYRQGPVTMMKWDLRKVLEEVSKMFALKPFDIVFTGCPERVSKERTFLNGGEKFRVEVPGLGELCTSFERKP